MLVFGGGISNSSPNEDLWKYHFHTQTWKKLSGLTKANFSPKMYHCMLGIGVGFQTTSDFTNTFPSHCKSRKGHHQLVTIPKHSRFCSYFRQQPAYRAFSNEDSGAIEMKTFSFPLEPVGFCAFQTTPEVELDPNRATSILTKDGSAPLFLSSEKETFAAAAVVEQEEGTNCQHAAAGAEVSSDANVLLLIGGKPLSSFSEISFWQMGFDSLSSLWTQSKRTNPHQRARRQWTNQPVFSVFYQLAGKRTKPSHTCYAQILFFTMWTKSSLYVSHNWRKNYSSQEELVGTLLPLLPFPSDHLTSLSHCGWCCIENQMCSNGSITVIWSVCSSCGVPSKRYTPLQLQCNPVWACYCHVWLRGIWWIPMAYYLMVTREPSLHGVSTRAHSSKCIECIAPSVLHIAPLHQGNPEPLCGLFFFV